MARIRSVHPGFFSDEDVVEVSFVARLALIGLGVEADDKGVFPWKPKTLKMRVFPADNVDMHGILAELDEADLVRSFEVEGRRYGVIRNFRKHQRPKSPNDIHPLPDDFRKYAGLSAATSEIDADGAGSFPQKGEIGFQMEDGGEDGEEKDPPNPPEGASVDEFWIRCPQKKNKDAVNRAWRALSPEERVEAFNAVADWYNWFAKTNPTATPLYPARYLRQKRWTDEGWRPPTPSGDVDQAAFWAESVNSGRYVSPSTCPPALCREMIERELATRQQLEKRGLVA